MPMRNRSNEDMIPTNEVGDVVRKHWAVHPAISTWAFAPHERMLCNETAHFEYLRAKSPPQSGLLSLVVLDGDAELRTSLRKKLKGHSERIRSISENTSAAGILTEAPESYLAIRP